PGRYCIDGFLRRADFAREIWNRRLRSPTHRTCLNHLFLMDCFHPYSNMHTRKGLRRLLKSALSFLYLNYVGDEIPAFYATSRTVSIVHAGEVAHRLRANSNELAVV